MKTERRKKMSKSDDKVKRAKVIATLFTAYGQGSDAERMAIYAEMLKDIPTELLDAVCNKAARECKYLPSIAELLEATQSLVAEATGTNELPFAEVWEEILSEINRTYVWDKPQFSRKEIEQLVRSFGWNELKMMETREIPVIRSQLNKMYDGICKRSREQRMNQYILGQAALLIGEDSEVRLRLK